MFSNFTSNGTDLQFDPRLRVYFLASSVVSLTCALAVVVAFIVKPKLRQHPDQLLLNRTILDAGMVLCHITSYALNITQDDSLQVADERCKWVSFFYQFAVTGSTAWYFVISVDLLLIIRNPFRSPAAHLPYYYAFVSLLCIATSVTLMATKTYGVTVFDFCWIGTGDRQGGFTNPAFAYSAGLYFGWSAICSLISVVIVVYVAGALRKALTTSGAIRRSLLLQLFAYIIVMSVEWSARLVLWVVQNRQDNPESSSSTDRIGLPFAILEGSRGVVDFIVWLATGRRYLDILRCGRRDEGEPLVVDDASPLLGVSDSQRRNRLDSWSRRRAGAQNALVSSVLRDDFICCIALGIVDSAPIQNHRYRQSSTASARPVRKSSALPVVRRKLECPMAQQCMVVDFEDYAPALFAELRSQVGIDPISYAQSFQGRARSRSQGMEETLTSGGSGSVFYYTDDRRYLVKTLQHAELKVITGLLPHYHRYLTAEPHSLLPRYCGLHQTRLSPEQSFMPIIVMQNILLTPRSVRVQEKYDLKGSWVNRSSRKPGDPTRLGSKVPTWKDCDLQRKFRVGPEGRRKILDQLAKDVQFLQWFGLMDYSLLVGVHDLTRSPEEVMRECGEAERRRRRLSRISTAAMPELPVDSRLLGQAPAPPPRSRHPSLTASHRGHAGHQADELLASYQRATPRSGPPPRASVHGVAATGDWKRGAGSPAGHDADEPSEARAIMESSASPELSVTSPELSVTSPLANGTSEQGAEGEEARAPFYRRCAGGLLGEPAMAGDGVPPGTQSIYYIGIIDIFQRYDLAKKVERAYKVHARRKDAGGVSAMNVEDYAPRFMRRMESVFV